MKKTRVWSLNPGPPACCEWCLIQLHHWTIKTHKGFTPQYIYPKTIAVTIFRIHYPCLTVSQPSMFWFSRMNWRCSVHVSELLFRPPYFISNTTHPHDLHIFFLHSEFPRVSFGSFLWIIIHRLPQLSSTHFFSSSYWFGFSRVHKLMDFQVQHQQSNSGALVRSFTCNTSLHLLEKSTWMDSERIVTV